MKFSESLKKNRDFQSVYRKGKPYGNKYLVMYLLANDLGRNRVGISVSKKVAGFSVSSVQSSAIFSLHVDSAEFRFCTIQLSLKNSHLLENGFEYRSAFRHSCGFLLSFFRGLRHDQIQDFFGERNNHASGQCQKSICPLAWIMAFQGQSYLHHSKSKQDQADGTDQ